MKHRDKAQFAAELMAGFGAYSIVYGVVSNNVKTDSIFKKITVWFAAVMLGGHVATIAERQTRQNFRLVEKTLKTGYTIGSK